MERQRFSAEQVLEYMKKHPITFAPDAACTLKISVPTVRTALECLAKQEIFSATNADRKQKVYSFQKYLDLLDEVE